jgi:hypothetical protein
LLSYGDMQLIINKYKSKCFTCVTQCNLCYRLALLEKQNRLLSSEKVFSTNDLMAVSNESDDVSPLTNKSKQTHVSNEIKTCNKKQRICTVGE